MRSFPRINAGPPTMNPALFQSSRRLQCPDLPESEFFRSLFSPCGSQRELSGTRC
jgi:hypothetical protein